MSNQVSMRACKKPPVTQSIDDENRISELPDGVVGHILSLLPIEDAVRTSVLSRDWKHKWTSMCDIKIDDRHKSLSGEAKVACFVNFVTRILMRTCNSRIRTFSLLCEQNYLIDYLETWISWVLMRNVKYLKIDARKIQHRLDSRWCFSGWNLLTTLELWLCCTLVLPVDVRFPNLKLLILASGTVNGRIKVKSEQVPIAGRVILKFPVLRRLVLLKCEWVGVNYVEIHAPELIHFQTSCFEELKNYEIEIFGTKLARFESIFGSINNIHLHAPVISYAVLYHTTFFNGDHEVKKTLQTRIHKILNQFPQVTCLKLEGAIVQDLVPSSESGLVFPIFDSLKSGLVFPPFNQLKEFHLSLCFMKNFINVLRVLPPLESLTVSVLLRSYDKDERGEPWPPEILSKLKKVELEDFWNCGVAFDFSKFILENAGNLTEMMVFISYGKHFGKTEDLTTSWLSKIKPKSSGSRLVVSKLIM